MRNVGVGGEGVDVGAIVRLLLLQVAIESSGLQSRTVSHLISEVEYDKCKHVTAVNSTKHGIESLAGVKEQVPSLMEACESIWPRGTFSPKRGVPNGCLFPRLLERRVDRGRCGGDKGTMRGIPGGQSANESLALYSATEDHTQRISRCRSHVKLVCSRC